MAPSILATFSRARSRPTMAAMALLVFLSCLSLLLLLFTLAFFLFLPIICILISISLSLSVLRRISILYFPQISRNQLEKPPPMMDDEDDDTPAEDMRVSVEYDQSEVPSFTESELGSEIGEDFSSDKEEIISDFWKIRSLKAPRDDRSFDEVLSFWKKKEKAREGGLTLSLSSRLASW